MRVHNIIAVTLAFPAGLSLAQQATPARNTFRPADWYKLTTVSTPSLSPDGGKIAFTVTTVR